MAQIMTKRGNMDNIVTYEFVCDTTADLATINPQYVTMGSVAIVIRGESGFEVYMANSQKEWINLGSIGDSNGNNSNHNTISGEESNIVGEGTADHMIINDSQAASSNIVGDGTTGHMIINDDAATVPTTDVGQADMMVLLI